MGADCCSRSTQDNPGQLQPERLQEESPRQRPGNPWDQPCHALKGHQSFTKLAKNAIVLATEGPLTTTGLISLRRRHQHVFSQSTRVGDSESARRNPPKD